MNFETNKLTKRISVEAGSLLFSTVEPYGETVIDDSNPALDLQAGTLCL